MIPGGIIGHEGGPCIILLLVPLGPVNILYLVWGTNSDMIFGPMGPLLGGTNFTVTLLRTVASSLEVVRPYCVVITTTPTSAHSLVQVPHKCGTAMAIPAL